jgi:hypothetical protein
VTAFTSTATPCRIGSIVDVLLSNLVRDGMVQPVAVPGAPTV